MNTEHNPEVSVTVTSVTYQLSDEPIKDGDLVYNEFAKEIDKCVGVFDDGTMCVQFKSGMRAVLSTKHYRKAIKQS